jgi:hypothetical protein
MKTRAKLIAVLAAVGLVVAACGGSESSSRVKNAALGKPAVVAEGSCDDGEMIEGLDDDDCVVTIKVGKSTRKASLQVLNTDGDWDTIDSVVAKRGGAKFDVFATDDDGVWLDGLYTFRVYAARSGKTPEFISADFDVIFGSEVALDDSTEFSEEEMADSGATPEMQSAMADIEKPATKFDDNCSKIFSAVDCALMFRPGKGPDFTTLGSSKWVKMCSTLLNRPESDCETEFKFATQMQNKSGNGGAGGMQAGQGGTMQPGQGGMQPGPGLDPAKVAVACAAIGMSDADCRAAIQMGPMAALQKFGDKAETFCKAYGGVSCLELVAKMSMGGGSVQPGALGQGGAIQPGQPGKGGMQPGQGGMQPGQNGMQPPTPGKG